MRKLILAGTALVVVGVAAGGIAVTKAGAQPDPAAMFAAPRGGQAEPSQAEPGQAELGLPPLAAMTDPDASALPPGSPQPLDDGPLVLAQNGPPAADAPPPPPPPGMPGPPGAGGMRGDMAGRWHRMMMHRAATFGLFYRPADKQLTGADVQKIAEAFLLWHGNRDWKVTQVAPGPDGTIGFAFTTSDGGVIARFTMDTKTGRLSRVG